MPFSPLSIAFPIAGQASGATVPIAVAPNGDGTYSLGVANTNPQQTITPNSVSISTGQTATVPAGSKGWAAIFDTGAGTFMGKPVRAGTTLSSSKINSVDVVVSTTGSAFVYWET